MRVMSKLCGIGREPPEPRFTPVVEVKVAPDAAPPPPPRITAGAPGAGVAGVVGVAVGLVVADGLGEGEGLAGAEGVAVGDGVTGAVTVTEPALKPEVMYSPRPASDSFAFPASVRALVPGETPCQVIEKTGQVVGQMSKRTAMTCTVPTTLLIRGAGINDHPDPGATFTTETLAGSNCRMMS